MAPEQSGERVIVRHELLLDRNALLGADAPAIEAAPAGPELAICGLCGGDSPVPMFTASDRRHPVPGEYRMVRCRDCDMVYMSPRPNAAALAAHYPADYSPFSNRGWVAKLTVHLRRREAAGIGRRLPAGARILEIGCAAGDLLGPLSDLGFDVTGVEPIEYAAALARKRPGVRIHTGTLSNAPLAAWAEAGGFDAVIMRANIEHLPAPAEDLRRLARLMRPGALLFVSTDNAASLDRHVFGADWYGFDVPRHLNLFTPATLAALLERNGFAVRRVGFSLVPTHWIMSAALAARRRLGWTRAARLLTPKNPLLLAALVPVTLVQRLTGTGGRMVVMAERTAGA